MRDRSRSDFEEIAGARQSAVERLLVLQDAQGWWCGATESNVTMDAEDLLARELLGIRAPEVTRSRAAWIRSRQQPEGTWSLHFGGPPDLSTTVEAYAALRLAGDPVNAEHMASAAKWIRGNGGIGACRAFTRLWFSLFGWWAWEKVPVLPPEVIFLPTRAPLSIYRLSWVARATIVPLSVLCTLRPVHDVPFALHELQPGSIDRLPTERRVPAWSIPGGFQRLDRLLQWYHHHSVGSLRREALRRAGQWIIERQEADGLWGGVFPVSVYSMIALHQLGYPIEHPILAAALRGLDTLAVDHAGLRMIEPCKSPVWDTALASVALRDAGVAADHPALVQAADWLLARQCDRRGDWSVARPRLAPGGWGFEFVNTLAPDTDDTAAVVLALARIDHPDKARVEAAIQGGGSWNIGMQSVDGGWGAFDADNTTALPNKISFCDFGELTDPPSADVTAHVVEMLARAGWSDSPAIRKGVAWLLTAQEADGSWFGRWGCNHLHGTGAAVPALIAAGLSPNHPAIVSAIQWFIGRQNPDGGWGEDWRSYTDPTAIGRGHSTASQTSWALLALIAAGQSRSPAAQQGAAWLVSTQLANGAWDEPHYTGTDFPRDFAVNYQLYRLIFPLTALSRYLNPPLPHSGL